MNDIEAIRKTIRRLESRSIIPFDEDADEVVGIAIQALEKQIPKEPIFKDGIASHYHCPTCGRLYWDRGDSNEYCDLCGQKLNWSGEDE